MPFQDEHPRVVVGVSDSPSSTAALSWASRLCAEQDWALEVVAAWPSRGEAMVHEVPGQTCAPRSRAVDAVDLALRQCGLVADGGRVTVHIENDDVVDALARRADGARLLILGASTPGGHRRAGFAPVSQVCRPHVSCPVVIVDIHDEADTRPA